MSQTTQEHVIGNRETGGHLTRWLMKQHSEHIMSKEEYQISTHKYGRHIAKEKMEGVAFVWRKVSISMNIDIRA